jgi:hypothetical protein
MREARLQRLDNEYRGARAGNMFMLPSINEIPTQEDATRYIQPLDDEWHEIMGEIEPHRQIVIHGLERILAVAEVKISSQ